MTVENMHRDISQYRQIIAQEYISVISKGKPLLAVIIIHKASFKGFFITI
jgi:hypothetical protein